MERSGLISVSVVVVVACLSSMTVASPAVAESISGNGVGVVTELPGETQELADGRTYTTVGNRQILLAEDPDHPFHHVAIDCAGACVLEGESGPCRGSCTGIDPDGDMIFLTWTGQDNGEWWLEDGSGKFEGASGSGTWKSEGAVGAGFNKNSWEGTIEIE